ncbi:MAG: hypothetical protein KF886_14185 [Candidatus Hydrogenedentes bacterium]|nr:hypothetical protein [Candidatus Hydrogenedentota bacterium]
MFFQIFDSRHLMFLPCITVAVLLSWSADATQGEAAAIERLQVMAEARASVVERTVATRGGLLSALRTLEPVPRAEGEVEEIISILQPYLKGGEPNWQLVLEGIRALKLEPHNEELTDLREQILLLPYSENLTQVERIIIPGVFRQLAFDATEREIEILKTCAKAAASPEKCPYLRTSEDTPISTHDLEFTARMAVSDYLRVAPASPNVLDFMEEVLDAYPEGSPILDMLNRNMRKAHDLAAGITEPYDSPPDCSIPEEIGVNSL